MAFEAFAGNFALNTSTGNQSVSGVGFQPKVVLFFSTFHTADGITTDAHITFGAATSSTSEFVAGSTAEDGQTSMDTHRMHDSDACIRGNTPGTNSVLYEADFTSMDADGFSINISTAPGSAYLVGYLALGGSDLTNVDIHTFAADTTLTTPFQQAITGVGFEPECIIVSSLTLDNVIRPDSQRAHFQLGWSAGGAGRMVHWFSSSGGSTTNTVRRFDDDDLLFQANQVAGISVRTADLTSFDSDGYTITWSAAPTQAIDYYVIALRGGQYADGTITTQTSTGTFAETGVGFQPVAGLFSSIMAVGTDVEESTDGKLSIGAASGATERWCTGVTEEDNVSTSNSDHFIDTAAMYQSYDYAQTLTGEVDLDSFDSDGFTLDQVDADPSGFEIAYLVFGSDPAAGGNPWYAYAQQ